MKGMNAIASSPITKKGSKLISGKAIGGKR